MISTGNITFYCNTSTVYAQRTYTYNNAPLFFVPARQATLAGGIDSFELIPGLHKNLKIRALYDWKKSWPITS